MKTEALQELEDGGEDVDARYELDQLREELAEVRISIRISHEDNMEREAQEQERQAADFEELRQAVQDAIETAATTQQAGMQLEAQLGKRMEYEIQSSMLATTCDPIPADRQLHEKFKKELMQHSEEMVR